MSLIKYGRFFLCCFLLLLPVSLNAHSLNDSYLNLSSSDRDLQGELRIAITDLEIAVGVDANSDGEVTWGEIGDAAPAVNSYVQSRLQIQRAESTCSFSPGDYRISQQAGGAYLVMPLAGTCSVASGTFGVYYNLLFDLDSSHRGIVAIEVDGNSASYVLSPTRRSLELSAEGPSFLQSQMSFLVEGIWHIWIGIDHILFLLAMLFGVIVHQGRHQAGSIWRHTGIEILKLVTAFTVAHSVTLLLGALGIVSLSIQLVESAIALTVLVSGINIVVPIFRDRHWQVAFLFGLIHGFGFANVLAELDLRSSQFVVSVLSFNIGVEIGQLIIVLAAAPILISLSSRQWSQQLSTVVAGPAIAVIGIIWFLERGLG